MAKRRTGFQPNRQSVPAFSKTNTTGNRFLKFDVDLNDTFERVARELEWSRFIQDISEEERGAYQARKKELLYPQKV